MVIDPDRSRPMHNPESPAEGCATGENPAWTTELGSETQPEVRPPLVIATEANAQSAARVRRQFTAWLAIDVTGEPLHDLVLAVYEAVANAAEHAYLDRPDGLGPVRVRAQRSRRTVGVTIADDGRWRPPLPDPGYRGRGLSMIGQLVEQVHVDHTPTGTVVYLRAALPVPPGLLPQL